jgi:POT family proton-dependent oligopeptide transporter
MTLPAAAQALSPVAGSKERYPPQAFYVIFTEGAERLSYYGLTAILATHLTRNLNFSDADSATFSFFFSGLVYFAPLLGGFVADRYLGRYRTILYVSLGYVLGHAVLSAWDTKTGVYVGCVLIAMGAGGIKPCVSAFMGDQFKPEQANLIERAYGWFYFAINVGSVIGILVVPYVFDRQSAWLAFLIPGIAMALALVIYVAGRGHYTKVPASGPRPDGFLAVVLGGGLTAKGQAKFPPEAINGVRATFRIAAVFSFISVFWALFFQYNSSWQLQAEHMNRDVFGFQISAGHLSLYNSVFVLALIPVMNGIYKRRSAAGREVKPLTKMAIGMYIAPLGFLSALVLQRLLDQATAASTPPPHALWQVAQYFFLSLAEVLISVTGLEFAFTQAPKSMKGAIMGVWFLTFSVGSTLSGLVAQAFSRFVSDPIDWQLFYGFFLVLALVAAVGFTFVARWYKPAHVEPTV